MVQIMNPNLNLPKSIKSIVFRTKLYYAKDKRLRIPALPKELSMLARELEGREVWAILLSLNREIEIVLPWIITQKVKQLIFNEVKSEEDIKEILAFLVFDVVNSYIRLLLPNIPSILYRVPEHVEVRRGKVEGNDVLWIIATKFAVWPTAEGEKVTNAITIKMELYNIPDEKDYENYSQITVRINLMQLIDEVGIRWDLARI